MNQLYLNLNVSFEAPKLPESTKKAGHIATIYRNENTHRTRQHAENKKNQNDTQARHHDWMTKFAKVT